jgi:hypothetical protein
MDAKFNNSTDQEAADPDRSFGVNDETFCRQVNRLKQLHEFLYQEAVPVNRSDAATLGMGDLSAFYLQPDGRAPTAEEWNKVEKKTQAMFLILTPALRRKFLMGGTPWIVAWLPIYFLGVAALSLAFAMIAMNAIGWPEYVLFFVYLIWIASLGAIGALAFIGMNALSIQDDITFDLTNMRLMLLRVALGALFGVVLTLPFGYPEFLNFCKAIWKPSEFYDPAAGVLTKQAVFLLLPFVLGFSTSLVILILSQLVEAIETFLGRKRTSEASSMLRGRVKDSDSATDAGTLLPPQRDAGPSDMADLVPSAAPGTASTSSARPRSNHRGERRRQP